MGFALFTTGRLSEALDAVERARALAPARQLAALPVCILAVMGRTDEARAQLAETHFRNALQTADRLSHVPAQESARWWWAWMRRRRRASGDVDRASEMLREALAIDERYGLAWRVRRCREALAVNESR